MPAVVLPRADLPFPGSLPEFQRLFPDDTASAAYLEAIRWRDGFIGIVNLTQSSRPSWAPFSSEGAAL
jgi:hypothetical protein